VRLLAPGGAPVALQQLRGDELDLFGLAAALALLLAHLGQELGQPVAAQGAQVDIALADEEHPVAARVLPVDGGHAGGRDASRDQVVGPLDELARLAL